MIKIAIVEDDYRVALVHEKFLSKIKDVVIVGRALNAKEAMKLLEDNIVDLLLLDIYMPDEMGISLLPKIKERFPNVDILMITAATDKLLLEDSIRYGVFNYLIKPVTLERFIDVIEDYKNKKNLLNSNQQVDQSIIDEYFGFKKINERKKENFPKGIDPLTLLKVKEIMTHIQIGITAEEMGEVMGASRTTARRYLEYLISIGEGKAEIEYGIVGRPERKYHIFK